MTLLAKTSMFPIAAASLLAIATPTFASDQTDLVAAVKAYDDAFNKGDMKTANAMCAPNAIIIDDFAPHVWQGADACGAWTKDIGAYEKAGGVTDGVVTIGKPWRVTVTGDRGYVVVPTTYTYKQKGKPVVESGAAWTLAFQKIAGSWKITGWAWAQHDIK